jgi:xylulokinase
MAHDTGYLLAVDLGTTTTRCVLFDPHGAPLGSAYREPPVHYPQPGWAEVAPEDWWMATVAVVREALEAARVPREQILCVGLCGLKHAIVPVDANGTPLANAMLWMDQRCRAQARWMTQEHGRLIEAALGRGPVMSTTSSAPKLRWLAENRPELLGQATVLLLPKDFVRFRLTGMIATDPTDAGGTGLYDPRHGDWSAPMLELAAVSLDKMPPVRRSPRACRAARASTWALLRGSLPRGPCLRAPLAPRPRPGRRSSGLPPSTVSCQPAVIHLFPTPT